MWLVLAGLEGFVGGEKQHEAAVFAPGLPASEMRQFGSERTSSVVASRLVLPFHGHLDRTGPGWPGSTHIKLHRNRRFALYCFRLYVFLWLCTASVKRWCESSSSLMFLLEWRQLPEASDGGQPAVTAPLLGVCCLRWNVRGAEHPPQVHLGSERLTEDEVDEGVQAHVESRQHDGHLLQVEETLEQWAFTEGIGKADKVVRDKANAEDNDQDQHVPAGLGELLGAGQRQLLLLRQPTGRAVVEED